MSDDRNLDAWIHTEILGRTLDYPSVNGSDPAYWIAISNGQALTSIPHYSADIGAAWLVKDKIREELYSRRKRFMETLQTLVSARNDPGDGCGTKIHFIDLWWDVTPMDICLAAYRARTGQDWPTTTDEGDTQR